MSLVLAAKRYTKNPSDIDSLTAFMGALAQESSVEEITKILPLDFERITGPALSRLTDLLPEDIDLLLSSSLWTYHFGLDEEANQYLERAKRLSPFDLRVLQVEIFLSYDNEPADILALCQTALTVFPNDDWLLAIKRKIEQTGKLTELNGPPLNSSWQKSMLGDK